MDIKIFKKGEKYFATFSHFKSNIKKYYIKKSFDLSIPELKCFNFNLYENILDIHNHNFNLLSPEIELEKLTNVNDYYKIGLITEEGLEYPFYIDFNKFYNVETDENIYLYNFMKPIFFDIEKKHTKFYLIGLYGDKHQLKLLEIKNKSEAFFKIPKKTSLISDVYDIICEINDNLIFKGKFPIIVRDTINFALNMQDFGKYLKFNLNPKFSYCTIDNIRIKYKNNILLEKKRNIGDLNIIFKDLTFFLPSDGFNTSKDIIIEYTISEPINKLNNSITKVAQITLTEEKEIIEINNIIGDYDYNTDTYNISWNNKSLKEFWYKFKIAEDSFIIKDTFISLKNFSKYNNNNLEIPIEISCSKVLQNLNNSNFIQKSHLHNYCFQDASTLFQPVIDYSESIYCDKPFGKIKWTTPSFRHYAKIKITTIINKRFLDEFRKPWLKEFILDKPANKFDDFYKNYSELLPYNFNGVGYDKKSVNDSTIVYDLSNNGWEIIHNQNYINIPLWFNTVDSQYNIELELYDLFNKKIGSANASFKVNDYQISDISLESIHIDRKQFLQFGEKGSVGEFFKIENPRPIDVRNNYADEFKTFLGTELTDKTNIDQNGISLFYYFNTNEGDNLVISYERKFNFYKIAITILKDSKTILHVEHLPLGDSFEKNIINIPKNRFLEEGEYQMKIQTFSSSGQASNVKEVSFFIHNEKPEKPFLKIKAEDHYITDIGDIYINKKYFEFEVTNNDLSKKYAGWKFKETHFFFRSLDAPFLPFADYIVQTNVSDGSIVLKNNTPIENGDYECKIINYDYAGNASDPHIFKFKLRSEIKITPHELFTNKPRQNMKWTIKKSQDSDGFFYFFRYSKDGITYNDYPVIKLESPYYISKNEEQEIELDLEWLKDVNGYFEGYYKLVAYEFSRKHPSGQPQYEFESPVVEVNELANPSMPIYSKAIKGSVAVFNQSSHLEWSYTNDLNKLIFETIHTEMVIDNPDTPNVENMNYKIILIEPHSKGTRTNSYQAIIKQPSEVGLFQFTEIASMCGIGNQKEGVWELRFITTDKYGNTNESKGYYTYKIALVKRLPVINNLTIANGNGSKYFGLYSDIIGFYVDSSEVYKDIENYNDFKDMFPVNLYDVKFIENPFNNQYTLTVKPDTNSCITVMNKLTENDKTMHHSKDGRYNILVTAKDPLERESQQVNRQFYIDTKTNAEINFINSNTFLTKNVTLKATAFDKVKRVYYKTNDIAQDKPKFNLEEIKTWNFSDAKSININDNTCFGIEISNIEYLTDGYKTIYYAIEEDSGNIGEIKTYIFKIDSTNLLIPIFDYDNKIYFSKDDEFLNFSWNSTNEAVNKFEIKLDKINITNTGDIEIVESFVIKVDNVNTITPVGPEKNSFINLGSKREISFKFEKESLLVSGQYMLTVKGYNIYGTSEINNYIFQIDYRSLEDLADVMINNRITLENNLITWSQMRLCEFYEVSYDNKSWIKTTENRFFVNTELVQKDADDYAFIYLRWKSKTGIYSKSSKIKLLINMQKIKKPTIEFFKDMTTDYNKMLKWNVIVEEPEKIKGIYYSFDKNKWHYTAVKGRDNWILNDQVQYPVQDGTYDVFVILVDEDPNTTTFFNKSEMTHSYVTIFANDIDKPIFNNLKKGATINSPVRLYIENKIKNVNYFIYVNKQLVTEGFELSSSSLRKFNIEVKAKKHGIEKIIDLISEADDFHIWSLCNEPYVIDINNSQILVTIDNQNTNMIIESMPSLKNSQIILYREKWQDDTSWNVLKKGDTLSLLKEWEFHISTFSVI